MMILEANGVCKKYLRKPALNGVDMNIESGKIVGLLGPNGSGKTTFLKLLAGLSRPSAGNIKICDTEIGYKTKELVAYLPDSDFLYPWMKIKDAKKVYATFFKDFNSPKFDELLDFMKLESNMSVKSLSRGMTEKLALALTLARDAKLIILDEPLNGVDPIAREQILGAILKGFNYESSIILASHLINEVERILDEAHFLMDGKIILSGDTEDIRNEKKMTLDEVYREVLYVD
ncbi:MAG: ABC transporter ATP-binding protein [Eubacteriales bacterium]